MMTPITLILMTLAAPLILYPPLVRNGDRLGLVQPHDPAYREGRTICWLMAVALTTVANDIPGLAGLAIQLCMLTLAALFGAVHSGCTRYAPSKLGAGSR